MRNVGHALLPVIVRAKEPGKGFDVGHVFRPVEVFGMPQKRQLSTAKQVEHSNLPQLRNELPTALIAPDALD